MKILHTSDWHIGKTLYGRKRYDEFEAFFSWLVETIEQEQVDVLLIAGDIFDTSTPGNRSQQLYYRFLHRVAASTCRHVVIIAGNHDSPSFLSAPRELLRALDVHVTGSLSGNPADEILVLHDPEGDAELIVCAVPHLRDRDIRTAEAGESMEDKSRKLVEGIRDHYAEVINLARLQRTALSSSIPIIAMGHLFVAGGQTVEGDGVRELYVGSLAHVPAGIFPPDIDYLALGHLHVPQRVNGSSVMRYSGSPLPIGFGEADQEKSVCLIEFNRQISATGPAVSLINIPVFQPLERIRGNWQIISDRISMLSAANSCAWLEINYEGDEMITDLQERLQSAIEGSQLEILRIRNNRIMNQILDQIDDGGTLEELSVNEVFEHCLSAAAIPVEQRTELWRTYQETLVSLDEEDIRAE
ncbi:MAG: Nuclease SbcCD subunit D [Nitrosomonas europaea]|uniref:exonuclease SbcCD subunit D C-terminal domain-containing protein n=1 Tax=Nitrosomonas TaxID=914 RepID=UPI0023F17CC7|nr:MULTISPECIES: exonuclease SbcCD subunit D C-terminal domain-containing protein [Nitrosomonas]MBV6388674.1 Nuclease SbcCD subunit D [Nitrosomonas europaea]